MSHRRTHLAVIGSALLAGGLIGWLVGRTTARVNQSSPPPDSAVRKSIKASAPDLDSLAALPYVDATPDPDAEASGVLHHDDARAWPGVNFYHSGLRREAYLMDMEGRLLHRWRDPGESRWHSVELLPDGGLLVVERETGIVRLDADSRPLWRHPARAHHDLWVADDRIHALARVARRVPRVHPEIDMLDDLIVVLSSEGELLEEISVFDLISRSPYRWLLHSVAHKPVDALIEESSQALDVLHVNHVEVFDGRLAGRSGLFARGNLLLSIRNLNAILILDGATREILWVWGPTNLLLQHHPNLLDNGHLLIFDNRRERSRIVELDVESYAITWEYTAPDFFSATRGSVQRLANGNTLVTESDPGYAFEVTPDGDEVWRFANPEVDEESGLRSTIWRLTRFEETALRFLDRE
jgi:hypothetical protein